MPKLFYLKVRENDLGYLYYGTRRPTTHFDVVPLAPFPNLPSSLSSFLGFLLFVWRNVYQALTKAIKALSSLLMYSVLVSRYASLTFFSVQFVHYFFFYYFNLFCRMGKLRMDCRTRVVPPLSCISKKLWIWTFLTYPQSHLADIPCGSGLSSSYPQSHLADILCGFGLSSPTLKAI
jgi:hypothetical protein